MKTHNSAGQYASEALHALGQVAHDSERVAIWCYDNPPKFPIPEGAGRMEALFDRIAGFGRMYPALVRGVKRVVFHGDYTELVWSKYEHNIDELQALAKQFRHLQWCITRSTRPGNTADIDWICDFGDIQVRLEGADVVKLERLPVHVDFDKLEDLRLRKNEPELQPQEQP